MPGNMLRTRKKDANLKPNRVLDKRGSRGMLYENEDLRIRTIHINDEVEKGHSDIKKLKKENEHLKREIWNLRDEYGKLEEMMQRLSSAYGNADGSPPETTVQFENPLTPNAIRKFRLKNYRRESEATTMSMYESEDEELDDMLMIDEDRSSYDSASIMGMPAFPGESAEGPQSQSQYFCAHASPEDDSSLESIETPPVSKTNVYQPTHHHLWQHLTSVPPDLEVVKEEIENTSNSNQSPKSTQSESPNQGNDGGGNKRPPENQMSHRRNSSFGNLKGNPLSPSSESASNSFFSPKIEITPAGSPTPSTSMTGSGTPSDTERGKSGNSSTIKNVQNLGCVTLIPKKFQVTSQLRISDGQQTGSGFAETSANNQYEEEDGNSGLSNSSEFLVEPVAPYQPRFLQNQSKRRGSQSALLTGKGDQIRSQTLSFPNAGLLAQPLSSFYQSEPSLSLNNNVTNSSPEVYLSYEDCERGFDSSSPCVHSPQSFRPNPNYLPVELSSTVERYVVIGYIEPSSSTSLGPTPSGSVKCNYELRDLRAQEIIDELESQFDSALEQIVGVRVMGASRSITGQPIQVFISLTNSSAVRTLVEKGLNLTSFKIHVQLVDVTTKCSLVTLSGLPSALSNSTITSALNQFGQVVGPLERQSYKGVDISERVARMHLISAIPAIVNIAGYQILAKTCDCQEAVESANANTSHGSVTDTRPTPPVTQQTARKSSLSSLTNSVSLDQIPGVSQHRHSPNVFCQDDGTRMHLMKDSSFVHPSSPSPSVRANLSLNAVNTANPTVQIRGGHRVVGRAVSSAPRLESNAGNQPLPPSLLARRRMSTCSEISVENVRSGQIHSSSAELGSGILAELNGSAMGNSNNSKKPLSRLLRSSPGSLVPPDSQYVVSTGGVSAKAFYRSLSSDPRRNSNASRCYVQTVTAESTNTSGFGTGTMEHGNPSGNRLLQSQMSHQSQLESRNMNHGMGFGKHQNDTQKSLPWCGCWGNGCI